MQDIVRRYGPSLKNAAAAEPVAYDEHFDRILKEAEKGSAAEGRRASSSPKVGDDSARCLDCCVIRPGLLEHAHIHWNHSRCVMLFTWYA